MARKMNEAEKRSLQIIARVISDNKGKSHSKMRRLIQKECPYDSDKEKKDFNIWEKEVDKCMSDYDKLLMWQEKML